MFEAQFPERTYPSRGVAVEDCGGGPAALSTAATKQLQHRAARSSISQRDVFSVLGPEPMRLPSPGV